MKLLKSSEIKKIILGIMLSDGHIEMPRGRFDFYSKEEDYAKFVYDVMSQITGISLKFYVKKDKRGYIGYRVTSKAHPYLKKVGEKVYSSRKELNNYNVSRVNELSLAHIWMCDGYLEHAKNRKLNKVQNIGWFCLEAFPKEELEIFQKHLDITWGIKSSLVKKPWGFGFRLRVGGDSLQKLISVIYQHVLPCFLEKKTPLYYKQKESADLSLPSAELFIREYDTTEDIVRHS